MAQKTDVPTPRPEKAEFLLSIADVAVCFPGVEIIGSSCRGGKVHAVCARVGKELRCPEGIQVLRLAGGTAADRRGWGEALILGTGGRGMVGTVFGGVIAVSGVHRSRRI